MFLVLQMKYGYTLDQMPRIQVYIFHQILGTLFVLSFLNLEYMFMQMEHIEGSQVRITVIIPLFWKLALVLNPITSKAT